LLKEQVRSYLYNENSRVQIHQTSSEHCLLIVDDFASEFYIFNAYKYRMLLECDIPPAEKPVWDCFMYLATVAAVLSVVALGLAFWKTRKKTRPEELARRKFGNKKSSC